MSEQRPITHSGREFIRFVEHIGSLKGAAEILGVTPDMLSKLRKGERRITQELVRAMYRTPGFRLSFVKLFDLD